MSLQLVLAYVKPSEISRSVRTSAGWSDNLEFIIWGLLGVVLLWVVLSYWSRIRKAIIPTADTPRSLFQELCHVHQLDRAERTLLLRAVEQGRINEPAVAFVNPAVLLEAGGSSDSASAESVALAWKLFGRDVT